LWYTFMSWISLRTNFYMTWKDKVFIADVVVNDSIWETMVLNVITRLTDVTTKLNAITKTHKYRKLQKGHHFIHMAMEVHGAPRCDMDHFIRECARLFHDKQSRDHLSLFFFTQFF
jgi:hypothetical protein